MLAERPEYADESLANTVLGGFCAAIDRAFERGGDKAVSAADRARRAAKQRVRDNACLVDGRPTMAGWDNHGDGEYAHISAKLHRMLKANSEINTPGTDH